MCVDAPPVRLLSSEGFGSMEIVPPDGCSLYDCDAPEAAGGISHVDNAFHRLRIGLELGSLFTFPEPVPAGAIGAVGQMYRGKILKKFYMVHLCAGALPMGFTWSLYYCQTAMEHQVSQCETWKDMKIMRDGTGNILLQARKVRGTPRQVRVVTDLLRRLALLCVRRQYWHRRFWLRRGPKADRPLGGAHEQHGSCDARDGGFFGGARKFGSGSGFPEVALEDQLEARKQNQRCHPGRAQTEQVFR